MAVKVKKSKKTATPAETAKSGLPEITPPQHPLQALRDEMDALFDNFVSNFSMSPFARGAFAPERFKRLEDAFGAFGKLSLKSDVKESDKTFTISAELPGVGEGDIDVTVNDGLLTISAQKKEESRKDDEDYHFTERHYGSIKRTYSLPPAADPDQAKATFANGVLTIEMPKKALAKPKPTKIAIKK